MHKRWAIWLIAAATAPGLPAAGTATQAHEVVADPPSDLAVTVYRNPNRGPLSTDSDEKPQPLDLTDLEGFALIRETRAIHLPAGESRVRFEGVAEGIEPASALIEGLPTGLVEKNRDAQLLSPESLVTATVGKPVMLVRSNAKTGRSEHVPGSILSGAEGVVFQTESGIEALRCSGLSETFTFNSTSGLSSAPTLSVLVRAPQPMTRVVTLSYLARGFDWAANYTATLSDDGSKIDLGAWVTLANANGVGFPAARTQVVAGRLNRESGEIEPIDIGASIVAQCWPMGSTSSPVELLVMGGVRPFGFERQFRREFIADTPIAMQEVVTTAQRRVVQEQLGDLKLYRVPWRTTVASRQSKQVRLLDRMSIPVQLIYSAELAENQALTEEPASVLLRTKNNDANHLGLPLPSGTVAIFRASRRGPLLLNEFSMDDLAIGQDVEIKAGTSSDVRVKATVEEVTLDAPLEKLVPLLPGISLRQIEINNTRRIEVSNARDSGVQCELRLQLEEGDGVVRADHPVSKRNGRPVFKLTVPAHKVVIVRYQTAHVQVDPVRDR